MPTVKQADSLWVDYEVPLYKSIDSTWANWAGTFDISPTVTGTSSLSGNLIKNTDGGMMSLRLNTNNTTWTALAIGRYKLMLEFANATTGYREEFHEFLNVSPQGV